MSFRVSRKPSSYWSEGCGKNEFPSLALEQKLSSTKQEVSLTRVPYHNQELLSKHLQKLPDDVVIKDVDPRELLECILNIALSEKKNKDILMNIDVRPRCQEITSPLHKRSITRSEEPSSTLG